MNIRTKPNPNYSKVDMTRAQEKASAKLVELLQLSGRSAAQAKAIANAWWSSSADLVEAFWAVAESLRTEVEPGVIVSCHPVDTLGTTATTETNSGHTLAVVTRENRYLLHVDMGQGTITTAGNCSPPSAVLAAAEWIFDAILCQGYRSGRRECTCLVKWQAGKELK